MWFQAITVLWLLLGCDTVSVGDLCLTFKENVISKHQAHFTW